jgi:serine/threonine-protein kinase/endoribonuclease IRE1
MAKGGGGKGGGGGGGGGAKGGGGGGARGGGGGGAKGGGGAARGGGGARASAPAARSSAPAARAPGAVPAKAAVTSPKTYQSILGILQGSKANKTGATPTKSSTEAQATQTGPTAREGKNNIGKGLAKNIRQANKNPDLRSAAQTLGFGKINSKSELGRAKAYLRGQKAETPTLDAQSTTTTTASTNDLTSQFDELKDLFGSLTEELAALKERGQEQEQEPFQPAAQEPQFDLGSFLQQQNATGAFDPNLFTELLKKLQTSQEEQKTQLQEFSERDRSRDYLKASRAFTF